MSIKVFENKHPNKDISEDLVYIEGIYIGNYKYRPSAAMCLCRVDKHECEYILVGDVFK